jgi:hypothetical protein
MMVAETNFPSHLSGHVSSISLFREKRLKKERKETDLMAHYCECRRRIMVQSHARHARAGWIYRRGHDLCRKCWRSLGARQAMRSIELVGIPVLHGFVQRREAKTLDLRSPSQRMERAA